ncbi:MAG TPA: ATP-dependent DNA helicase RecG [Candidatus Blautia stercoripullorum]|uniref:ATP-dependent DNA helicase RecG n=1 Tax=Candidatus Blautia stercoripullorum TaxID=2838502 RepID=A0A9D2RBB3_9FIRM|nr:ATP-dependent DNA helicase RecG [Candidatus Blautia stercoripullorum]
MKEQDNIRTVKGIGEKTEKLLGKLGILTVGDFLRYYPRDYDEYQEPVNISQVLPGKKAAVAARISGNIGIKNTGRITVITASAREGESILWFTWFNMPFLRNTLRPGGIYIFRGTVIEKNGRRIMEHPEIFSRGQYEERLHVLFPVYSLTKGLTNKFMAKTMKQVLEEREMTREYLPEEYRNHYHLADYNYALQHIHFPKDREDMIVGRKRLVFDEFFLFILSVRLMKEKNQNRKNYFSMKPVWDTEKIIECLPYSLTKAQKRVWNEIERDMTGDHLMSRLVQGDVGSGKTIIAFLSMILTAANGWQAALMAPTEVLARQHYEELCHILEEQKLPYKAVLLTGSCKGKEKKNIYKEIEEGGARLIIGTHALIQEKVVYYDLALVITDEQHRFGVNQREDFSKKGRSPHVLVMSATPIPRTLGIILYGDLDISVMDELPAKRLPIKNCVVDTSYRLKAYRFIENQILQGRQAYIICPMVEESEGLDGENVIDYSEKLSQILPSETKVAYLHGRMKPSQKNDIMDAFARNEIQILVSTTVIEVGVNVPNATVMMVENAERFGLAQLHQLRGRVGRGEYQSYCIFVCGGGDEETRKRREILVKSNDGFFIAGEDLRLRGPGDLLGIRQSGMLEFRLGDIFQDADILKDASEAAGSVLLLDPDLTLEQNRGLKRKLMDYAKDKMESPGL